MCQNIINTLNILNQKSMTDLLTMKHKKEELFLAYFEATEELEDLRKQVRPKPTTKEITKAVSLSLTDARLSATLREYVFNVCSILAYIYVAGTITYDYLTKLTNQVTELCQDKLPVANGWKTLSSSVAQSVTKLNLN